MLRRGSRKRILEKSKMGGEIKELHYVWIGVQKGKGRKEPGLEKKRKKRKTQGWKKGGGERMWILRRGGLSLDGKGCPTRLEKPP